ncbi:hypothetical protein [Sphingomicrobium arenosum]|uniref:hypothetical protein n=1 Tax=Sphingomicrobium arenosum TaxID=2233861 RepID=UPI00223FC54F|nr:hypothetical protein [Sphingomicrobium arenosum]
MGTKTKPAASFDEPIELAVFWKGKPEDAFTYARFYWPPGSGERESLAPRFIAKRRPGAKEGDVDTAARVEVLLPEDAPEEYLDPDFLVRNYDAQAAADEGTVLVQVTMRFPEAFNLHGPYERCRRWLWKHYVEKRRLPIMVVLHAPHLKGSSNPPHVHALVLARSLGRFGWGEKDLKLGTDRDRKASVSSWDNFL